MSINRLGAEAFHKRFTFIIAAIVVAHSPALQASCRDQGAYDFYTETALLGLENFGQTIHFDRNSTTIPECRDGVVAICIPPMFQCETSSMMYFLTPDEIDRNPFQFGLNFFASPAHTVLFGEVVATHNIVVKRADLRTVYSYLWSAEGGIAAIALYEPEVDDRYPSRFFLRTSSEGPLRSPKQETE